MAEHLRLAYDHERGLLIEPPKKRTTRRQRFLHIDRIKDAVEALQEYAPNQYRDFAWWWNDRRMEELRRELAEFRTR